jgi:MYXO-CTERM domain-containing protein
MSLLAPFPVLAVMATLTMAAVATPALADVLPPQDCQSMNDGDPCTNAGANADENGRCLEETCTSLKHDCDGGADGGTCGSITGMCLICEVLDAGLGSGSGSSSGTGSGSGSGSKGTGSGSGTGKHGSGAGNGGDAGTVEAAPNSSSGCATTPVHTTTPGRGLFAALGVVAVTLARRRRRR